MSTSTARSRVTIFSLGGTIASTGSGPSGIREGVTPRLEASDLVDSVAPVRTVAELETVSFRQVPSGDLTIEDLVELAGAIRRRFDDGVDGVVVTQGTDTMEETAFVLDLLVHASQPVVVTGAMRNPTVAGPDGPANLLGAVQVAASPDGADLGTVVVMNDQVHAARFVRKMNSTSVAAFHSPSVGPIGWVVEGRPRIVLRPEPLSWRPGLPQRDVAPVALLAAALGDDARIIAHVGVLGYRGLVVEAFGGGHVPARIVGALQEIAAQMPVVLASRTGSGEMLRSTYAFAGSEQDLLSRGLISSGYLDGRKSRVLVSLCLSAGGDVDDVRRAFEQFNH